MMPAAHAAALGETPVNHVIVIFETGSVPPPSSAMAAAKRGITVL
ncbi:MAG: hypothetical protein WC766_01230 [Patescibacteria group bacterium]